jgi:ABC-2 type transport system permease protein
MMMRNIVTLTVNDLAIAFKNKTLYLILFIPFFVFFSLKLLDRPDADFKNKSTIGLIQKETYPPAILKAVIAADRTVSIIRVLDEREGRKLLKEHSIDALLVRSEKEQNSVVLVVLKKESLVTLYIVETFSALQKSAEGNHINWISAIAPLQDDDIQKQTLPTWILMLVLMVSFIVLPAQVAEEKEKKLLLALLQTPMRDIEWLIAKVFLGMILILTSVLSLHLLGNFHCGNILSYGVFVIAGSFCFSSYGIFLGFLCRNQAGARTLGVIFYLPHLLPSAFSGFSKKLTFIAPFLPSYQFYQPIKSILLDEGGRINLPLDFIYLMSIGLLMILFTWLLMKKRWQM